MTVKKIAAGLCCFAVLAMGVAEAKKLTIKNLPVDAFQGVDADGNLDGGNFTGFVKLSLNLKTGKASVSGKAVVPNLSFTKVTFNDEDFAGIGDLISDKYVVAKNGRATYTGKYENVSL
ncbi:MAG TPA: hypothetical protein VM510_11025 [Caulifigura sp.]|jgi:hypothetical protein|nr:hypothetical protein [Caulifigura sp.]